MPTYLYETISDDPITRRRFELRQGFDDAPLATDPESGLPVRRVISGGLATLSRGGDGLPDAGPGCGPASCGCGRFS
jgi:predicted nucleic acid-binding Zn ribbon protein